MSVVPERNMVSHENRVTDHVDRVPERDMVTDHVILYPLRGLVDGVSFYPLDAAVSVGDVSRSPRLELCRPELDEDLVVLKAMLDDVW
jgi:hypothetical protein